jgi:multiple sugar transport system permease protein
MVSTFLGVWNDFMGPLLYLRSEENFTLSIGVYMKYLGTLTQINLPNEQMATGILMLIPPLIIFIIFQKQLINGVVFSGIKG